METPKLAPRTKTVALLQGDQLDSITDQAKSIEAQILTAPPRRHGDPDPMQEAARKFDARMDEAVADGVQVTLVALPRKAYQALRNRHPVRMVPGPEDVQKMHEVDATWGFNWETFGEALVPACIEIAEIDDADDAARSAFVQGIVAGTYVPGPGTTAFLDELADGDFSTLYSTAVTLNQGQTPDPKVRLSSLLDQTSDETSTSPARLA